jgi:hypothetical protein
MMLGMALGKRESQIAILTEDGELIEMRICTAVGQIERTRGREPGREVLGLAHHLGRLLGGHLAGLAPSGCVARTASRLAS